MRTETTTRPLYTFAELSPEAQARAVADARDDPDMFWVEHLTEEFAECLAACGFTVDKLRGARTRPAIVWSGFWSQGDGAGFAASWRAEDCKPAAWLLDRPVSYTRDGVTHECPHNKRWHAAVRRVVALATEYPASYGGVALGRGNTMRVDQFNDNEHGADEDTGEDAFKDACESLADAFYRVLETEYDYITSAECAREWLENSDGEFTAEGVRA